MNTPMNRIDDKAEGAKSDLAASEQSRLEQVRELLFGAHARDVERRIARLEARLGTEVEAVRDELRRRFSELEAHVQNEIEALSNRVDTEATARVDALSSLAKENREADTSLELRVHRLDETSARSQRDLRRLLLDQSKTLGEEIRRAREQMNAALDEARTRPEPAPEPERVSLH